MTMTRREFSLASVALAASIPSAKYRIVDAQIHVWANDPHYPWAPGTKDPPKEDRTPAMALELMKANGVDRTVIAQYIGYKWDNRYCLHSIKKYAPCFRGVCRVDPSDPAAPDQLSHLTEQGFHGVRISPAAGATGDWIHGRLCHRYGSAPNRSRFRCRCTRPSRACPILYRSSRNAPI